MQYTQSAQPKLERKWDLVDMPYNFTTAVEASKIIDDLKDQLKTISYNKDLRKLMHNCELLVGKLGSAEVRARQLHKPYLANKPRQDLMQAMDYLEKVIIVAKLME